MIAEIIETITCRSPDFVRALNLVEEQVAIKYRYKRLKNQWKEHTETCKSEIMAFCAALPTRHHLVLLGSGILCDVPVEWLSTRFERVHFIDLVHLPLTKFGCRRYPNIEFHTMDLTGIAHSIVTKQRVPAPEHVLRTQQELAHTAPFVGACGVVSCNILSQLSLRIVDYLETRAIEHHDLLKKRIESAHLALLEQIGSRVLLISDLSEVRTTTGGVIESDDSVLDIEVRYPMRKQWTWRLAPSPEIQRGVSYQRRVGSFWLPFSGTQAAERVQGS